MQAQGPMSTSSAALFIIGLMAISSTSLAMAWYVSTPSTSAMFLGLGVFFALLSIACLARFHFELLRNYYHEEWPPDER